MNITYIHHSGFLVELNHCYLLFDYTEGDILELNPQKPMLVMASHRHGDHFSPKIFDLSERVYHIRFLISDDIKKSKIPTNMLEHTDFIKPRTKLVYGKEQGFDEEIQIETLKSTDEGVAFLVSLEGSCIYHAGDLNNWTWKGEPDSWNKNMQVNYTREIETLAGRKIDVAFLPLDPRQEENFYLGIDGFMANVGADKVFPMHLWGDFKTIEKLKHLSAAENYRDRVVDIQKDGDVFTV